METKFIPRWLTLTLGSLLILLVAVLSAQQLTNLIKNWSGVKPQNTMSVSAEGKITAAPDLATVTVGVMSQGSDAATVKNQNNDKINKVIAYVEQQGIAKADITTSQLSLDPQQDWKSGTPVITGYQGNQSITIKVHGIDKSQDQLNAILNGVVDNGANQIEGTDFSFSDPNGLQQQARLQAIDNAKQKAVELAKEAGLTLGKVISVSEQNSSGVVPPLPMAFAPAGAAQSSAAIAPNVQPGTQDITETMSVVFEVK